MKKPIDMKKACMSQEEFLKTEWKANFNETNEKLKYCLWEKTGSVGNNTYYETECGEEHIFIDGNPTENRFKYCPYCGKDLKEEA